MLQVFFIPVRRSVPLAGRARLALRPWTALRWSLAICYGWFGILKFLPGMSPAEGLAADTIAQLSLGLIVGRTAVVLLVVLECAVAVALLWPQAARLGLLVLLAHMACTFTPFVLNPEGCFTAPPLGLTLVGQYIIKNLVVASAAWALLQGPMFAEPPGPTTGT